MRTLEEMKRDWARVHELLADADKGPWIVGVKADGDMHGCFQVVDFANKDEDPIADEIENGGNATFMAESRQLLPTITEDAEALAAEVGRLKSHVEWDQKRLQEEAEKLAAVQAKQSRERLEQRIAEQQAEIERLRKYGEDFSNNANEQARAAFVAEEALREARAEIERLKGETATLTANYNAQFAQSVESCRQLREERDALRVELTQAQSALWGVEAERDHYKGRGAGSCAVNRCTCGDKGTCEWCWVYRKADGSHRALSEVMWRHALDASPVSTSHSRVVSSAVDFLANKLEEVIKQTLPAFGAGGAAKMPTRSPALLIQIAGSEPFERPDRVVNINLNDDVEVELTERGKQVLAVNELAVRKQYTGPRLRLPFWEFINIFGAERCWYNGAAPVCNMHVKIHRNGVYRPQPVAPPDGEEYRPKWPSEALLAVCGQWETWSPNPESPNGDFTHMRPDGGKTWKAVECEAAARLGRLDAAAGRKKATTEQMSALLKNWSSEIDHAVAAYNEAYAAAAPAAQKLAHGTGTRCPTRRDALPHVFDLVSRRCVFCGMLFEGNAHEMPIMGNLRFSKTLPIGKVVGTDRDLWSCEHFGCAALIPKAGFCSDHDFRPGPPPRALRAVHKWWQQVETGDVIQARYEDPCFRWRGSNEWFAPDERLWRNCGLRPLDRLWSSVETEAAAYLGKMDAASAVPRMTPEQLAQALGVSDPVSSALNGEYHNAYTDAIPWKSQLCSHETPGVSFESKAAPYGGTLYRPIRGGLPIPWELIGGGAK